MFLRVNWLLLFFTLFLSSFASSQSRLRPNDTLVVDSLLFQAGEIQRSYQDSAYQLISRCEKIAIETGDSIALMKVKTLNGIHFEMQADFDQATTLFFEALAMAERFNRDTEIGMLCNNLGTVYFDLKQFEQSEIYYQRAFEIMNDLNNVKWLSNVSSNLAGVFFVKNDFDRAIELLNEAIKYGVQAGNFESVSGSYANLAMVMQQLGRTDEALATFEKGVGMLDSVGDKRGVCIVLNKLGELQYQMADPTSAKKTISRCIALAKQVDHKESIMNAYKTMSAIYSGVDSDSALLYLNMHLSWKDTVYSEKQFETIAELEKKYQIAKKQEEIETLKIQSERDVAVNSNQKLTIFLLVGAVLFVIILSVLIARQLALKKRSNSILQSKNEVINESLAAKEMLMREIHHRVKNNFQMISSILMIQANSSEIIEVKSALLDSRNRVQSMATTHKRLYQEDDIRKVELKSFVTDLVDEVEVTNSIDNVEISIEASHLDVDIDIAVALGLILTEALTNSMKYAFNGSDSGTIAIFVRSENGNIKCTLSDNGSGFNRDEVRAGAFGLKLIDSLAGKLSGTVSWENRNGTFMELIIPLS
ncbi:MAG: two-component sensor histidine kinase/Tfp pilus assembly protein PilF [Parvicellaceae bacterium]|jgi:two-component sensor histidine kinase/Tfp pilus assembly protein PilF